MVEMSLQSLVVNLCHANLLLESRSYFQNIIKAGIYNYQVELSNLLLELRSQGLYQGI